MKSIDISKLSSHNFIERTAVEKIHSFISDRIGLEGKILVLYGLRRTGKTTMMEQIIQRYKGNAGCALWEIENNDSMDDVNRMIIAEQEKGTSIICIDEITKAKDFITNSSVLADVFAKEGTNIIVAGTDSLGFVFADRNELYDRTIYIQSTHIPFAEHCRVLGTNDMDDYIMFGGLMSKGRDKASVHDYDSACRYLNSSVSGNISRSVKNSQEASCLDVLSMKELSSIIDKMVELYSGSFNKKIMQEELKTTKLTPGSGSSKGAILYKDISDNNIVKRLILNRKSISHDFVQRINADLCISTPITDEMVQKLQNCLIDMDVLSVTDTVEFAYDERIGWREKEKKKEFYIIQPAIKYYHLQEGLEFIETEDYYKELTVSDKFKLKNKLDEMIKGDMLEQIVLFETASDLPKDRYYVTKPKFTVENKSSGEYDMLVYDKTANRYWGFEIKHTTNPHIGQYKNLNNPLLQEIIDMNFGNRQNVCVLYRGESLEAPGGMRFINITDFLCSLHKTKDIHKTMLQLNESLKAVDLPPMEPTSKEVAKAVISGVDMTKEYISLLLNPDKVARNKGKHD